MDKYIYDEKNGLYYELIGDYYFPCVTVPDSPHIGIWGMRRLKFLRENKKVLHQILLCSGTLNSHLEDIDRCAEEMFAEVVKQLAALEEVTEELKSTDQMEWVSKMNNIHNQAKEVIYQDLIYT